MNKHFPINWNITFNFKSLNKILKAIYSLFLHLKLFELNPFTNDF